VIHQVAQRRVQVLPCPIDQLGTVVGGHVRQLCKVIPDICCTAVLNLGVGEYFDDPVQSGKLAVVETTRDYNLLVQATLSRVSDLAHKTGPPAC